MTIAEFVEKHGISAVFTPVDSNPGWEGDGYHYRVRIRCNRRSMTIPFTTGTGWDREPNVIDVLGCLQSDGSSLFNGEAFEDWAREFGYDTDSRKALSTYKEIKRQSAALERVLGGRDAYSELMTCDSP